MTAALALQQAVVGRLKQISALAGIYHDAPARADFPYAVLTCADERDWSCKGRSGREIMLHVAVWDEQPERLLKLESDCDLHAEALPVGHGWLLSSLVLTSKRRSRNQIGRAHV